MLEVLGYLFMFIDHIFKFLKMNIKNFNPTVGTFAFPIFAYMAARGFRKTKDKDKYVKRILIFAFASQIPYILMIYGLPNLSNVQNIWEKTIVILAHYTQTLNVGFTILLGLLLIKKIKNKNENTFNKILFILICLILAQMLKIDYKAYGIALILLFYYVKKLPKLILYMTILNASNVLFTYFLAKINRAEKIHMSTRNVIGILIVPVIYYLGIKLENKVVIKKTNITNSKKKENNKKTIYKILKYAIYPVHMLLIFIFNYFNVF